VSRYSVACVLACVGIATLVPMGTANATARSGSAAAQCTASSYRPVHALSGLHAGPRITFSRRLNIAPHSVKRDITWSAPATAPVIADASAPSGAHVTESWIWRAVARHYNKPVASAGHRTPRTATSPGTLTARNSTARTHHDIEFNGVTRFRGSFTATRCADVNPRGVGHVVRAHGSWVTFGKTPAAGLVQCGAGSSGSAIEKAALSHCP
jgi:hypothetical protein